MEALGGKGLGHPITLKMILISKYSIPAVLETSNNVGGIAQPFRRCLSSFSLFHSTSYLYKKNTKSYRKPCRLCWSEPLLHSFTNMCTARQYHNKHTLHVSHNVCLQYNTLHTCQSFCRRRARHCRFDGLEPVSQVLNSVALTGLPNRMKNHLSPFAPDQVHIDGPVHVKKLSNAELL